MIIGQPSVIKVSGNKPREKITADWPLANADRISANINRHQQKYGVKAMKSTEILQQLMYERDYLKMSMETQELGNDMYYTSPQYTKDKIRLAKLNEQIKQLSN